MPVPQGRSFLASLRDGLRPPLTDRPAPEIRKTAGKPPKERAGGSRHHRRVGGARAGARSAPNRYALLPEGVRRPPGAGHRPPSIATRFSITRPQTVRGGS
ncbi:hypothetical protein B1K54_07405 [Streptomyces sp. fd1-xmd]|nr:hypothetical protein B1K54_07405 [Streptomyces sp. fd1-xmd]